MSAPARHHHIIWWMSGKFHEFAQATAFTRFEAREQGFLTTDHEFVDREEGKLIARAAGQLLSDNSNPFLFSEDMW
jgi:hypothetical protein